MGRCRILTWVRPRDVLVISLDRSQFVTAGSLGGYLWEVPAAEGTSQRYSTWPALRDISTSAKNRHPGELSD
ncbi:hypothetical protein CROQUDRAFT_96856 [Cronartium quercuum f. sp. fusiforme G11]|uniref:Uncharacterized protein n=1 Tax=Cronartium quercuum f. sp. fusiforme G11 TaxID=708437 RepID=A0A9P6NAJ5_9BASI|nr:hypothetical protein CROQUDRAFT_96856 [Cronartium quercuum f. sp. fusiforme G11]